MNLTKYEISEGLQKELGISKLISKEIVDQVFEQIRFSLEEGKPVKLSRFGNFELRDKKARPGRNPKTGEPKLIEARRVVTFKASQKLKAKVQQCHSHIHQKADQT
jgi:integration host factor subunit alpha